MPMESNIFLSMVFEQLAEWRVLLDILVFTIIIYLLYRTLRATGTWQIVIGLTIAALGAGLASLIGLRGVEWIFSNFSQVALIALLIIFQPEMRKILERTTSFLRGLSREDTVGLAQILSGVLFSLSQNRWGGIIVIPGTDSLKQWVSGGIKVEAIPSHALLMSIFDPHSSGHDGAVIISDGRIDSFSVRLPLSQLSDLPENLGTRHHASQGLSEKTDALIMTVSEERGVISFFEKGKRRLITDPKEAVRRILEHGVLFAEESAELPSPITLSWRAIIEAGSCFLVACLFWIFVVMGRTQTADMIFTVPIQYSNLQSHLSLEGDIPQEVKLHLEGPLSTLTTLDLSLLKMLVDLSAIGEGKQSITLSEKNALVGKKVKVLEIIPSEIQLNIQTLHKKFLNVEAQLIGTPAEGFEVHSIEVIPQQLPVYISLDDDTNLDGHQHILRTTPIYLYGLRSDTTVFGKIVSPPGVQSIHRRWPDIEVKIKVIAINN